MSARDDILARLRAAPKVAASVQPEVAPFYQRHRRHEDEAGRIARLTAALEAARAEVFLTGALDWPQLLAGLLKAKGLKTLLSAAGLHHSRQLAQCHDADLSIVQFAPSDDGAPALAGSAWRPRLFNEIDASLTLARGAIAETGSVIVWPDRAEPRTMSLVPPVHVVLLDPATIHADLPAAIEAGAWSTTMPTNVVLISGPSKTSDIQQTTAFGAHGPRELIVLICRRGKEEA